MIRFVTLSLLAIISTALCAQTSYADCQYKLDENGSFSQLEYYPSDFQELNIYEEFFEYPSTYADTYTGDFSISTLFSEEQIEVDEVLTFIDVWNIPNRIIPRDEVDEKIIFNVAILNSLEPYLQPHVLGDIEERTIQLNRLIGWDRVGEAVSKLDEIATVLENLRDSDFVKSLAESERMEFREIVSLLREEAEELASLLPTV